MVAKILLVSPSRGFGELIHQVLVDDGGFDVTMVDGGEESARLAQATSFDLAIIDCDVDDLSIQELRETILAETHSFPTILVPPNNDTNHPLVKNISPSAFLTKPFYLPDLIRIVAKVLKGERVDPDRISDPSPSETPRPSKPMDLPEATRPNPKFALPWLEDINSAAQYLTRLSLETAARASIILHNTQIFAYAGEFSQPTVKELAEIVSHYWGRYGGGDLARFIKLESEESEYMLYATGLENNLVLALVFDSKTPFSQIRSQASQVAQGLTASDVEAAHAGSDKILEPEVAPALDFETAPELPNRETIEAAANRTLSDTAETQYEENPAYLDLDIDSAAASRSSQNGGLHIPLDWLPSQFGDENDFLEESDGDVISDSDSFRIPGDWQPEPERRDGRRMFIEELLSDPLPSAPFPYEQNGPTPDDRVVADTPAGLRDMGEEDQPAGRVPRQPIYPSPESLAETRPQRAAESEPVQTLEPTSPSLYNLTYACVLIPRFPQHHLISDLADQLAAWMPQICIAFGWRVEHFSIRPDYMQWMVNVPPATSPGYLMRIIRKITSQRVFYSFPRLADDNPSREFWAPGYLIVSSDKLPPQRMVQNFISNTRRRQGF